MKIESLRQFPAAGKRLPRLQQALPDDVGNAVAKLLIHWFSKGFVDTDHVFDNDHRGLSGFTILDYKYSPKPG